VTTIPFALSEEERVSLILYDITGSSVMTILDGPFQAGNHRAILNGSDLSSGIYFYRLRAGSFSASRKTVLLK